MTGITNGLTLPNSLANGQTTDASLVMANYNTLLLALNRALLDAGGGSGMNAFGSQLHNLGAGSVSTDAVNLGQLSSYLLKSGGTMTGALAATSGLTAATQTTGDNSAAAATTAFVQAQLAATLASSGFLPKSGGTMTGKLITLASAIGGAGLNLPQGAAPTSPVNGDLWATSAGVFAQIAGATQQLAALPAARTWSAPVRSSGTTYTNNTGHEIEVVVSTAATGSGTYSLSATCGGVTLANCPVGADYAGHGGIVTSFTVPAGATYSVTVTGSGYISTWAELA
jgi:hypothetical protein